MSAALTLRGIANTKRRLVRSIIKHLSPHFRASGYRHVIDRSKPMFAEGNTRPLMLMTPDRPFRAKLFLGEEITALTEFGDMGDAWGGGAITTDYGLLCLEDLITIEAWAARYASLCAAFSKETSR